MKTRTYGPVRVTACRDGSVILILPKSLVRDLRLHLGDTVSMLRQNSAGWRLRFFRRVKRQWVQLLQGGETRAVKRPR